MSHNNIVDRIFYC